MKRPILALTMGDPAGIGAEITVKALADPNLYETCRPLVIGDAWLLEKALQLTGTADRLRIRPVAGPHEGSYRAGVIDVLDLKVINPERFAYGQVSAMCGDAAYRYVEAAVGLALDKRVDATVTSPLNKEALHLGGHHFSGHTEIYASLTGTRRYCMMLAFGDMLISHVSTHISLREACDRVKKERIMEVVSLTSEATTKLRNIQAPKIGVAGLNPHCGESGLFGTEEIDEIIPAVAQARAMGFSVEGPIPPDTIFSKLRGGWFDAALAMYHDQGHIPLKVLGFTYDRKKKQWDSVAGVNLTLGLPIIRASVDHGTAFDQAGAGTADETSLKNAIEAAIKLT